VELILNGELSTWIPVLAADPSYLEAFIGRFWNYFQVALGLGFVIFIHELGHFLAAKFFGVKCEKFYVGFDVPISIGPIKFPRTLGKFQWGETEYGIGIIPLGGYVKMLGQDDDPRNAQNENERIKLSRDDAESPTVAPKLDPRSYPAKPVYARMIIISAGVIMNLISAVFMAAIAYSIGVPYTPTVVGQVIGGSPAWESGIQPGDYIVQVGSMTQPSKQLDFREMSALIATDGLQDEKAPIPITIEANQSTKQLSIQGSKQFSTNGRFVALGITPANLASVSSAGTFALFSNPAMKDVDLKSGDKFISINGQTLPPFAEFGEALSFEVNRQFQASFFKPVDVVVERKEGEVSQQFTRTLPPNPMRTLGLGFKASPVRRIAKNSLAMMAGVQVGDQLIAVDDQPVVDGWTLPLIIARKGAEGEVKLTFQRGNTETQPSNYMVTLQPFMPSFDTIAQVGGMMTIKHLGIAYDIEPEVSFVEPESPAAKAGIQIGDKLGKIKFYPKPEYAEKISINTTDKSLTIDSELTIATLMVLVQELPLDLETELTFTRDAVVQQAKINTYESNQHFWYTRGVMMQGLSRQVVATSVTQALGFGLKETWRRLGEVVNFLRMLVTGRVPVDLLGGPLRIAQAASIQAEQGPSTLLIFLTLLSANLAVVNFLPIPALDGGHIMFLTAEAAYGKPVNEAWQIRLTIAGVLALLCLMAFVILNDIFQMIL
jgi:regulator of sigma E protease